MRSVIALITASAVLALSACSAPADPGDQKACELWSKAEQSMLQTVAVVYKLAQEPGGLTEAATAEFNTKRNELVAAYDAAKKAATSDELKNALQSGIDTDAIIYFNIAGATNERIQASKDAVAAVIQQCAVGGIDVGSILGTTK